MIATMGMGGIDRRPRSLARRRLRESQAKVPAITQRRGRTAKPRTSGGHLTIASRTASATSPSRWREVAVLRPPLVSSRRIIYVVPSTSLRSRFGAIRVSA